MTEEEKNDDIYEGEITYEIKLKIEGKIPAMQVIKRYVPETVDVLGS